MKKESIESIVCSPELSSYCIFVIYLKLKDGPLPATTDRKGLPLPRLITELPINSSPAPVDLCSDSDMGIGSFPLPPAIYLHLLINGNLNPVTRILLALRAGGLSPAGMELQLAAAPCSLLQSCVSVNKCRVSRSSVWSEDLL